MENELIITQDIYRKFLKLMQSGLPSGVYKNSCSNLDVCNPQQDSLFLCCKAKEWTEWNMSEDLELEPPNLSCEKYKLKV
jgi:hypothetical protein